MKRLLTIIVLSTGLAAGPALADQGSSETRFSIGFSVADTVAHNYDRGKRSHWNQPRHRDHRESWEYRESRLHLINEIFVAKTTSNVRAGPGTGFYVTDTLHRHERVRVVGRVKGRNWYMVRIDGRRGFVYAPLLRPADFGYRGYRGYRHNDSWRDAGGYR